MPTDDREISQILGDRDKRIAGDLRWLPDDNHGHEFVAPVLCSTAELVVRGQRCTAAATVRDTYWAPLWQHSARLAVCR